MPEPAAERPAISLALAGGGTGGHIRPGLHLLEHVVAHAEEAAGPRVADVLWFHTGRPVEARAFGDFERRAPWPVERVPLRLEPQGGGAPGLGRLARHALPAVLAARRALARHRSDVLLGLGGYTCLPAVLAARSLGIPVALLEINAVAGRATRGLAPLAARVLHAWKPARESERHRFTGPPLGPGFAARARTPEAAAAARAALGFPPDAPLILVLGGSQGAAPLNAFCREHGDHLVAGGAHVLHQTGPGRLAEGGAPAPRYRPVEFLDEVDRVLIAASLVLCRGGASTLAEVGAAGVPAWVVPYPHHRDRHQERNAERLGEGCRIVPEPGLDAAFARELARLAGPEGAEVRRGMTDALGTAVPVDAAARVWRELDLLAGGGRFLSRGP